MPSIYIASPLGFSEATRDYYSRILLHGIREAGLTVLDPWGDQGAPQELAAALRLPAGGARLMALARLNARLGARNEEMIRVADGMIAILDGADVDSGTAAEVGFASALGKPIVGLRTDIRRGGENEAGQINLQVEHFIRCGGSEILGNLKDAVAALVGLLADAQP